MAKYTGADCRLCRREGCKLFLKGERCTSSKCAFERNAKIPGQHGSDNMRRRASEYSIQLREKQKVKRAYNLLEKQFYAYYKEASKSRGVTGTVMLSLIERRLDNVIYRLGLADSRAQARQYVNHGMFTLNGKNVDIPSMLVKVGDVIAIRENKANKPMFKDLREMKIDTPRWLQLDMNKLQGKVVALPEREDIDLNIKEHLIIELYSK
jgi:small subunit ribosomal protein S4